MNSLHNDNLDALERLPLNKVFNITKIVGGGKWVLTYTNKHIVPVVDGNTFPKTFHWWPCAIQPGEHRRGMSNGEVGGYSH